MKKSQLTYKAGIKRCQVCNDPLGEIHCSRRRKQFYCSKPSCSAMFPGNRLSRLIKQGELTCDLPGCEQPILPGPYPLSQKRFFCSEYCRSRLAYIGQLVIYKAGEKHCQACNDPLEEIRCTPCRQYFYCRKPECKKPVPLRVIKQGELTCCLSGCDHPVPPGSYSLNRKLLFCSTVCKSRWGNLVTYKAGEKRCEVCDDPLGEILCTASKKQFVCDKPGCSFSKNGKRRRPARIVHTGELLCSGVKEGIPCGKPVPPGSYSTRRKYFFCSDRCHKRFRTGLQVVNCSYCGRELRRGTKSLKNLGKAYCSTSHRGKDEKKQLDIERCGPHLALYQRYVSEFAEVHYRGASGADPARQETRNFFWFLARTGVSDIDLVTPAIVGAHIKELRKTKQAARIDFVKVMFDYFGEVGIYDHPNPVRPRIHYTTSQKAKPRPYSQKEMNDTWRWLKERGDTRSKVAVAFGEEFGPRGIEVCNIRLSDLDLLGRRIWIRNPTKNKLAGWAPFSDKTELWLRVWLEERLDCDHDFLLTNNCGNPMRRSSLRHLLCSILLKEFKTKAKTYKHAEGLDSWSFHGLRHTNTTNLHRNGVDIQTNMQIHRWKDPKSVLSYNLILDEDQEEQYHRAMKKIAKDRKTRKPPPSPISMDEYLASRRKKAS